MRSGLVNLAVLIVIGSVLLLVGFFMMWYPSYVIDILELNLGQSGLTQAEINALQGSLNWWRTWGTINYEAPSYFLFSAGILVLVFAIIYYSVTFRSENSGRVGKAP